VTGSNHVIAITGKTDTGNEEFDSNSEADAVRLAACWNAFEGIATKDIARCHVVGKPIDEYQSVYKKLHADLIKHLVIEIRESIEEARMAAAGKKLEAFPFGIGLSVIDPVKSSSDNSASRQFVCPTTEEISAVLEFHYGMGGKKSVAESLAKLIAKKNGGAA
jgi:hypothetical protein